MAWQIDKEFVDKTIPTIGICVPHTGSVNMYWVERCYGPLRFSPVSWCHKRPYLSYGPPIAIARNEMASKALQDDCDYIFFLDSDVVPHNPKDINLALYQLYSLEAPLVSGLYRAKKRYGWHWAAWTKVLKEEEGYQPLVSFKNPIFPVDVAGLGCTLIHREVLEKVPKPWFVWKDMETYSEDFYFFRKCKEYGFDLYINGNVRFDHIGQFMISAHLEKAETLLTSDYFGMYDDESE